MIGGVTNRGGFPSLSGRVTLSGGVKFCHENVSRWGNPHSRGRIRVTSNSRQIQLTAFGEGSTIFLKRYYQSNQPKIFSFVVVDL